MIRITSLISLVLLSGLPLPGSAIDSDVVYSAPYIWVNPETGEVEMKNPGPQPKAHPDMSVETPATVVTAAEEGETSTAGHAAESEGETAAHINAVHPVIVLAGMIATLAVIFVMGRNA